jgi:protein-L-isoaspartate(D-aspartate) O-methyltransferase
MDAAREQMVRKDIEGRDVRDAAVLRVLREVPRHRFVPEHLVRHAYADHPLPIGGGQTISQPYIVAAMTELAGIRPDDRVLEVGTGSGYQAAVLSRLAREVYTIEILPELAASARERLLRLGYTNVTVQAGDGYLGWPEHAPFDAILVTAAPDDVPEPLIEQLKPGGRMVIPVGPTYAVQSLLVVEKDAEGVVRQRNVMPVRFVPLVRE